MNEPLLDDNALQKLGEQVRAALLANYDASGITNRSGTLRAALANATIQISGGETLTVCVTLDDRTRPARPGETRGASTLTYGPPTFQWAIGRGNALHGRSAMSGRNMFFGRSGRASHHGANVVIMGLSDSQAQDVRQELETAVGNAIARLLSRSD